MTDLAEFERATRDKMAWDSRAKMIASQFGSVDKLHWRKAFASDIDLFARLVKDILKLDQAQPGRPGPRPALDYEEGVSRLRQYMGQDYALDPFPEALRVLGDGRSIRSLARKTGLSKNHIHRLLTGDISPDAYAMSTIAESFGKHPSYFLEWRTMWIASAIVDRLTSQPESSISMYRKLKD